MSVSVCVYVSLSLSLCVYVCLSVIIFSELHVRSLPIFTARCYASAVLAMGMCLSVSVCHKSEFY